LPAILLIRHAQASYGAADYDVLSELGHRQAFALDSALARRGVTPALVVSGPARRHRDTAQLCERMAATAELAEDARWGEYDTDGVLARYSSTPVRLEGGSGGDGISSQQFQTFLDAALQKWQRAGDGGASPLQSWPGYLGQVEAALGELGAGLQRGQTALVLTSAGAIAAACCAVLDLPAASFVALNRVQVNTGITKVVCGRRGMSLVSFNEHSHLEEAERFLVTYR
jgi:broad specificity phosphatase PhoE